MTELEVLTNETNRELAQLRHEIEELTHALAESRRLHHNALVRVHRLADVAEAVLRMLACPTPLRMAHQFDMALREVLDAVKHLEELRQHDTDHPAAVADLTAVRLAWQAFKDAACTFGSDEIATRAELIDELLGVDCEGTVLEGNMSHVTH